MADKRPQSRVVDLSFVRAIGLEAFPRLFGQSLDKHTSDKESNTGPLLPSERFDEASCYDGARGSDSADSTEGVEGIKTYVAQHDTGGLLDGPFVGVCESNPVELVIFVSNVAGDFGKYKRT